METSGEIKYLVGQDLIGHRVEVWQDSKKYGSFRSVGEVIKYRKRKSSKLRENYLVRFKGTKSQGKYFDMWMARCWLKQLT